MAAGLSGCLGDDDDDPGIDDDEDVEPTDDDDEEPDEPLEPSGSYDVASGSSFATLNSIYNIEAGAGTAISRTLDSGYTFTPDEEVFPLLYDLWSDDGSVWVFEVRDGLEFSDPYGQVTAETFVYLIEEIHKPEWAASPNRTDWLGVEVEQTGELEFQAELPAPNILWPETFDPLEQPVPKELLEPFVEEQDLDGLRENEELLELEYTGNLGPYVLDQWERGAGTRYSRNDDYYLQDIDEGPELFENAPYFDGARIQVIEEEASRLGALETGEINNASIPPARVGEFEELDAVDVYSIPQPFNRILIPNMRDNGWNAGPGNLFRVPEFRQAMACAIGKEELIAGVYRGFAEPHFTWQPEWSRWFPDPDEIPTFGVGDLYGSDVAREKAEEAFDQVEYDYGFDGDVMVNPDGDQVVLDIYWTDISEVNRLLSGFLEAELEENLGVEIELEVIDGTRFQTEFFGTAPEGGTDTVRGEEVEWDAPTFFNPGPQSVTSAEPWDLNIVFGFNTFPRFPLTNQVFFDGATASTNAMGWYPEFDAQALFDQARGTTEVDELQEIFQELFIELSESQPLIMLIFQNNIEGYTAGLQGPIEDFANGWDFPAWHLPD